MKRFLFCFLGVFSALFLMAESWHTTIEFLCPPAQNVLPANAKNSNILLVNNCPIQPANQGHKTIVLGGEKSTEEMDLSEAPFFCLMHTSFEMGEHLSVSVYETPFYTTEDSTNIIFTPISQEQKKQLCEEYSSDILLILNKIEITDVEEVVLAQDGNSVAYLEAFVTTSWSVYDNTNGQIKDFQVVDTAYWETSGTSAQEALDMLPHRQEALLELAKQVGEKTSLTITPYWQVADRYIYAEKDENMQKGMDFFTKKQWQEAADAWLATSQKDPIVRAYAMMNAAFCYEVMENLDKALEYTNAALKELAKAKKNKAKQPLEDCNLYLAELQNRIALQKK